MTVSLMASLAYVVRVLTRDAMSVRFVALIAVPKCGADHVSGAQIAVPKIRPLGMRYARMAASAMDVAPGFRQARHRASVALARPVLLLPDMRSCVGFLRQITRFWMRLKSGGVRR